MLERIITLHHNGSAAFGTQLARVDRKSIALIIIIAVITHHGVDQMELNIWSIQTFARFQKGASL